MLECTVKDYDLMLGSIDTTVTTYDKCMSQCTGCKCNCQCSCRVSECSDVEWEDIQYECYIRSL